ncbi:hypothetical protein L6452_24399 [Arctium lappa]|uniref:Uncharacterized protein n=1 Tax=Arctium lappa TaxID=4217 RepID=A0ACB9ADP8_ARCLA|nr:hypothetical protein L6452_24399 [Arctium lappa]
MVVGRSKTLSPFLIKPWPSRERKRVNVKNQTELGRTWVSIECERATLSLSLSTPFRSPCQLNLVLLFNLNNFESLTKNYQILTAVTP